MRCKIGTYKGDLRQMSKVIQYDRDISVKIKEGCSVLNPVLVLSINPIEFNYFKLYWGDSNDETKAKYYYKVDTQVTNRLFVVSLKEDLLQTYKSEILNLRANVIRQEYKFNKNMSDDRVVCERRRNVKYLTAPNTPFGTSGVGTPVVLTVSGGGS